MKPTKWIILILLLFTVSAYAKSGLLLQPFKWKVDFINDKLIVAVDIKENHYLYAKQTKVKITNSNGVTLEEYEKSFSELYKEKGLEPYQIYSGKKQHQWGFFPKNKYPYRIRITYQGCRQGSNNNVSLCFPIAKKDFIFGSDKQIKRIIKNKKNIESILKTAQLDKQTLQIDNNINDNFISKIITKGGVWLYLAAFIAGVLSTLTPCVLPMIPITISVLGAGKEVDTWQAICRSAVFVFGIILTFTIAATIAALGGKCLGADILGNKLIVGIFTILLVVLALSMLGVYELQLPLFIRNRLSQNIRKGWIGALLMGCAGGFVSFPCTGPILTALLSIVALSGKPIFGSSLLAIYALGFGLPFFIIGSGFGKLKLGSSMTQIKNLLGISILIIAIYCLGMAFPYFSQLMATGGILQRFVSISLIIVGFLLGAIHTDIYLVGSFKKFLKIVGAIAIALGVIWNLTIVEQKSMLLKWNTDIDFAMSEAKMMNKPILIDFTAAWCTACKKMDVSTFQNHDVVKELSTNWIIVKVDSTTKSDFTEKIQQKYNVVGLPTTIILDSKGEVLKSLSGFQSAQKILNVLKVVEK